MRAASGWEPIHDGEAIIGLYDEVGGGAISLEPGGQFELSGAPLEDVHATAAELDAHLAAVNAIAEPLGIRFLGMGGSPTVPPMPEGR